MLPILALQTLLPALATGLLTLVQRRGLDRRTTSVAWQFVVGLVFGAIAVFATETGPHVVDGGVLNVRDAAPLVAGLAFGAPAGVIAGVIGGAERWFCVAWGGGMTTRVACSLSTVIAGVAAASLRKTVFDGKRPAFVLALGVGITTEVLHMLLVLVTNMGDLALAFAYVESCSAAMVALNGLACGLALTGQGRLRRETARVRPPYLANDLGVRIFAVILVAFVGMTAFTLSVTARLSEASFAGLDATYVMLYLMVFMEVIVTTALFIILFQLIRHRVVDNIKRIEGALAKIAAGKLDTRVDVTSHQEFSALSRDIDATVDVLRGCIDEAERRMEADLALAHEIQLSSLPSVFPPYPDRRDFDIYASMDAAREVGGDFYDFFMPDDHTLVFLVADVSGKGVPAALFMMKAKTELRSLIEGGLEIDAAMTEANTRLCRESGTEMFVTAWLGKLDLARGRLEYANAGHNPPLVRHAGGSCAFLRDERPDLFLAGLEGVRYRRHVYEVAPGDRLFLYTDGVTEARSAQGPFYGNDRLRELLSDSDAPTPRALCEEVRGDVAAFATGAEQSDDITMLAVDIRALTGDNRIVTRPASDSVELVRDFLSSRLPRLGADARTVGRVMVCMDEVYSNICKYSGAKRAIVDIARTGDGLVVGFADDGAPFDPTAAPEPDTSLPVEERPVGGLGIHLLRGMAKDMEYARTGETNVLTLTFTV